LNKNRQFAIMRLQTSTVAFQMT